jgi:uncharacterized protein (UPF0333 family)
MFKRNKRGQNVAEYSILIALVIAAAVAMQTYVKRSVQGRVKDASDARIAPPGELNFTWNSTQYEPYYVDSCSSIQSAANRTEDVQANGATQRNGINEGTIRKQGSYEKATSPKNVTDY